MAIGIISHAADEHAAAVIRILQNDGKSPRLIDTAAFPANMTLSFSLDGRGHVAVLGDEVDAFDTDELHVVWWRRPRPYGLNPQLDPSMASFAYAECHEAMAGMWHSLDVQWVNPPEADEVAHHKPRQLALAARLGLSVPNTLITNDPQAARAFIASLRDKRVIYKTFLAQETQWRETRLVGRAELDAMESLRLAPVIFQEFVDAEIDLRVTVFGEEVYAAAITTPPGAYEYDYRVDLSGVRIEPASLPKKLEGLLVRLVAELGLLYGAIDLRLTPEGDYIFLEINPAGEFLFIEEKSGIPLTSAMADLLTRLDKQPAALRRVSA